MTVFAHGIGGGRWNGYADCIVDEVSFWDSALTAANVSTLYNSGTPRRYIISISACLVSHGRWHEKQIAVQIFMI